jgi:predicted lipase
MLELVPPNLNYRYFENSDFFPFRPHFEDYCRINAWWLSEFSLLAYADPAFIYTKVRETNTFEIPDEGFFSNGTSQGFIAQSDDAVVIVFRGTELGKLFLNFQEFWADFCADINVELIPWRQGGWVHKGFSQAFDLVWKQIEPILSRILKANPNRTVWFTGHSLGAALATLAASRFSSNSILYSFGDRLATASRYSSKFKFDFRLCPRWQTDKIRR